MTRRKGERVQLTQNSPDRSVAQLLLPGSVDGVAVHLDELHHVAPVTLA